MVQRSRVVIIGAGFGGLFTAKGLRQADADVTLVDRNNYHLFTPLLYQVANALLAPSQIAHPVRSIFRGSRVRFEQGEVRAVDLDARLVEMEDGSRLAYDLLVIAPGSDTNFFGHDEFADVCFGLKSLPDAVALRNHVTACLERAARTADGAERRRLLTFVVVGGGPTGVELAGLLAELLGRTGSEYPEVSRGDIAVHLLEAADHLLTPFQPRLRAAAQRRLAELGVVVSLESACTEITKEAVTLAGGRRIEAATVVWAAGVRPTGLRITPEPERSRGRLVVDDHLRLRGREDVYAAGDLASGEPPLPMLASVAQQQGEYLGAALAGRLAGRPVKPFRYRDRGILAIVGRNEAVAEIGRLRLSGFPGWLAWLFIHLLLLIGFRNRIAVAIDWAAYYFFHSWPVRLILWAEQGVPPKADEPLRRE